VLFSDDVGGKIWAMTNGTPAALLTLAGAWHFTTDEFNRLVAGASGSPVLRLYTAAGVLLTNAFASVAVGSPLARGPGGFWGPGVFCVNTNGDLLSLDSVGGATRRGTGISVPWALAFGPDGALYVSEFNSDLIWRIGADAPRLQIQLTLTNTVAVFWPSPSTGWMLQQNTNSVASVNWSNVTSGVLDDGTTKTLIVNPPTGHRTIG
jgi:hypothetical protein